MKPGNVRADAARILAGLLSHQGSLANLHEQHSNLEDLALLREICFGTCRWFFQLNAFLGLLMSKPLKVKDLDIHCLLLIGIYQLRYLRVPDHAVVNETVTATVALHKPWAKALVNGILRQFLRTQADLERQIATDESAFFAHPDWLIRSLKKAWPEHWQAVLEANNMHPPMTLRVNQKKISREHYLQLLLENGITAAPGSLATTAVYLDAPVPVHKLPGFSEGLVSVQDEASQLIPELLQLETGHTLLDACAAPGGKACHLLEIKSAPARLVALDIDAKRLSRVQENLDRLELQAELQEGDATTPEHWWDGRQFDRILLDAPCSATGIIRRQPDIKILRRASDVEKLVGQQEKLLEALWSCLKPGGLLLYSTCSVLPDENQQVLARFINRRADAKHEAIIAKWGVECSLGRQLLPEQHGPDGFYYARLSKQPH